MAKPKGSGQTKAAKNTTSPRAPSGPFRLRGGAPPSPSHKATALLVYGLDRAGKPKAGRFAERHSALARKAAIALNLNVCALDRPQLASLAPKIPVGRVHAQGKTFIPHVKRAFYELLSEALQPTTSAAATAKPGPSVTAEPAKLPKDWESIAAGDLVLYSEGPREGYWEVVVVERDESSLTCRYRDYPRLPQFKCTVDGVALLRPSA